jgi:hypothetical protein
VIIFNAHSNQWFPAGHPPTSSAFPPPSTRLSRAIPRTVRSRPLSTPLRTPSTPSLSQPTSRTAAPPARRRRGRPSARTSLPLATMSTARLTASAELTSLVSYISYTYDLEVRSQFVVAHTTAISRWCYACHRCNEHARYQEERRSRHVDLDWSADCNRRVHRTQPRHLRWSDYGLMHI